MWRPQIPTDVKDVVTQLSLDEVYLDNQSVLFVFNLYGGHFEIVVRSFTWIKKEQENNKKKSQRDVESGNDDRKIRSSMDCG